ncbi:MAG: glutamine--fructose-6-phosphate transaminase (isomerizing) [Dehalococcoidia bacterium]|nr:MAG: glutamine--fructose-6-phosphate transaminase (isomerizing) [Dehalococcoidia bacterium]
MCGIIGYCGHKPAVPIVLEALKRLEYRGYDSAGIASLCDGQLLIKKDAGQVDEVIQRHNLASLPGLVAIGHTRWATHGGVTQFNAHPHSDCDGRVAVVHNGIIENNQQLRQELTKIGHKFTSETDSEIIPHLLEDELKNGCSLEQAVLNIVSRLAGSYAFLVISLDDPGKIIGTRKSIPLIVGTDAPDYYVSSDALAFSQYTNQVMSLEDNEVVMMTQGGIEFFDAQGKKLVKQARKLDHSWAESHKEGYQHFMLKEIMEQAQVLGQIVHQDEKRFTNIALDILRARQVIITACGTSRYAALVGRYLFSRVGKKFCDVVMASEFGYFADSIDRNTVVIAVSQSGETADVVEGVKAAKDAGAQIISIVNRPNSILADLSDQVIYLNCGAEIAVAATKSFLSQLAIFYLLSFSMVNSFDESAAKLANLSSEITRVLDWNKSELIKLSQKLKDKNDFYYIARGINFALASEGALKLKEISYIHAEGMPAGELKHGTLALIEDGTPVVVLCPADHTFLETLSNAMETKSRGAYIIGVSDKESDIYDSWIKIPEVDELLYPMVAVVPLQLLAYYLAINRGCDPDKPRNLAKSVTVK